MKFAITKEREVSEQDSKAAIEKNTSPAKGKLNANHLIG